MIALKSFTWWLWFYFYIHFHEWKKRKINQRVDQILLCNKNYDTCIFNPSCHAKVKWKLILDMTNILSDLADLFKNFIVSVIIQKLTKMYYLILSCVPVFCDLSLLCKFTWFWLWILLFPSTSYCKLWQIYLSSKGIMQSSFCRRSALMHFHNYCPCLLLFTIIWIPSQIL